MRKHSWFTIIALLSLLWVVPAPAHSQDDKPEVVINHTVVKEEATLKVETYFSVRFPNGEAVTVDKIAATNIILPVSQQTIPATPIDPTTPIKIAIVLDQSGSMADYVPIVKEAAMRAVDEAPAGALIGLFTFTRIGSNDEYLPKVDFTENRNDVKNYIRDSYISEPGGETCLYTAAYLTTNFMLNRLQPEERRAIVLFTDGKDEDREGKQCSDKNVIDVTTKANPRPGTITPIYTIGLCAGGNCARINPEVLNQISSETQALAVQGAPDTMGDKFFQIMNSIKNQKMARGDLRPCGDTQATLRVELVDGTEVANTISLGQTKCYLPIASKAKISNIQALPLEQKYSFNFSVTNNSPVEMNKIEVKALNPNGIIAHTETLTVSIPSQGTQDVALQMSDTSLKDAGKYTLQVFAYSSEGFLFTSQEGKTELLATEAFNHVPIPITFEIRSNPVVDYTQNAIRIDDVEIGDEQEIIDPKFTFYRVRLLRENLQVFESDRFPLDPTNPKISIPLATIPQELIPTEQQTTLNMQIILETSNVRPIESPIKSFLFPVKPKEPFLKRYGIYVLIALVLIAIAAGFWYLWRNRKPKAGNVPMPYNPPTQAFNRIDLPGVNPAARQNPNQPQQQQQQSAVRPAPNSAANQPARYNSPASSANASIPTAHFDGGMPDNGATMIYTPPVSQGRQQNLNVRVVQTPDRSQLQNQTISMFPCTIGRSEASVIVTGDKLLSRQHVEISLIGGQFYVADLSKNGLFINEQRQQANTQIQLRLPTTIRLGQDTYIELSQ
ncbi:FHA domain-containing protein [Herpetosiphon llansteffanensis]|uniref:FHA domain-containing protein n=1 Tax=Herpetosiphon llansteffanensis TaxID=2094568 RepID=UPI000D7BF610|nr:FHA domain-containing protein [Herpetosiphon llansteffanensis]